jgi:hypothetical protein
VIRAALDLGGHLRALALEMSDRGQEGLHRPRLSPI